MAWERKRGGYSRSGHVEKMTACKKESLEKRTIEIMHRMRGEATRKKKKGK